MSTNKINNQIYEVEEETITPQDVKDKRHKAKKNLMLERKPFTFNGIPTY